MLLQVAVFRTSEIASWKCGVNCLDCVQIWGLLSLSIETMPYYRVLPPLLDKPKSASAQYSASSGRAIGGRMAGGKIWLLPGLISCFACLTLGLFFLN